MNNKLESLYNLINELDTQEIRAVLSRFSSIRLLAMQIFISKILLDREDNTH